MWHESHSTFSDKVEKGGVNNDGCLRTSLGLIKLSYVQHGFGYFLQLGSKTHLVDLKKYQRNILFLKA
jgi:hypothetical protein